MAQFPNDVSGIIWALFHLCGPALAFVGRHWLLWAFVGLRWPLLAAVGLYGPALAFIDLCWPSLALVGCCVTKIE